ncbi:hypothetical protein A1O3_05994 [Capronia epimyces CBS 606.96]|uniref:Uncharacterized protein n=1 Tax=Capronia epimyces CBS 606.96 TaxID=1182542 RepID=W9YSR2_9EURO|nr:uncharacterized protein A1O3_05994 [Capronia epimyces CBS 606.96]EXJ85319.1 hypothetical protein A1O3_05994 [Capronia epimyces CBS 606.96]
MTSLIFGSIWLGHKGLVKARRDKQRRKNYERWEGLRDEYDEQRKITRESRSLDIQRTGASYVDPDADRPILTLRDQQEANDARTSWRPQEVFDGPTSPAARRTSVEVIAGSGLRAVTTHKTGSTWDEELPQPLKVHRRNWDDQGPPNSSANVSRSGSVRNASGVYTPRDRSASNASSVSKTFSPHVDTGLPTGAYHSRNVSAPTSLLQESIEPIENKVPGGKMAELIEMGESPQPSPVSSPQLQPFSSPQLQPFSGPQLQPFSSPKLQPFNSPPSQQFTGFQTNPFATQAPVAQPFVQPPVQPLGQPFAQPVSPTFLPPTSQLVAQPLGQPLQPLSQPQPPSISGNMEEWWNRP